jgi:hypothetical protein
MGCLDLANASAAGNTRRVLFSGRGTATEGAQNIRVRAAEFARASQCVLNACTAESAGAVGACVKLALEGRRRGLDAVESVALSQNVGTRINLKGVAGRIDVSPKIVDGVEDGFSADLRATARRVVDVVALERHLVIGSKKEHRPSVIR